jgi:hypothetical protein
MYRASARQIHPQVDRTRTRCVLTIARVSPLTVSPDITAPWHNPACKTFFPPRPDARLDANAIIARDTFGIQHAVTVQFVHECAHSVHKLSEYPGAQAHEHGNDLQNKLKLGKEPLELNACGLCCLGAPSCPKKRPLQRSGICPDRKWLVIKMHQHSSRNCEARFPSAHAYRSLSAKCHTDDSSVSVTCGCTIAA